MIASAGKRVEPGGSETYILQELKAMTYTENTLENIKGLPFHCIELIFLELWEVMALEKLINGLEISPELRNVGCRDKPTTRNSIARSIINNVDDQRMSMSRSN